LEEGKTIDIITARATPVKHNALAKKNENITHGKESPGGISFLS